jgi:hypothetical protein
MTDDEEFEAFKVRLRSLGLLRACPQSTKPQIEELPVEDVFDMGLTGIDKTFLEQFGIRVRENG